MNAKQRLIHGTMLAAALGNALPFQIVGQANAQQAVNVQGIGGTGLSSSCATTLSGLGATTPSIVCEWVGAYVINASPTGPHNTANSPTVNLATDQTTGDPCMFQAKTFTSFSGTTVGAVLAVAGVSGKKIYGCSLVMLNQTATNWSIIEGTNATCSGGTTAGVLGNTATTSTAGMPFIAGAGLTFGNGGGEIFASANSTNGICVLSAATSLVAGTLGYIQQ